MQRNTKNARSERWSAPSVSCCRPCTPVLALLVVVFVVLHLNMVFYMSHARCAPPPAPHTHHTHTRRSITNSRSHFKGVFDSVVLSLCGPSL